MTIFLAGVIGLLIGWTGRSVRGFALMEKRITELEAHTTALLVGDTGDELAAKFDKLDKSKKADAPGKAVAAMEEYAPPHSVWCQKRGDTWVCHSQLCDYAEWRKELANLRIEEAVLEAKQRLKRGKSKDTDAA